MFQGVKVLVHAEDKRILIKLTVVCGDWPIYRQANAKKKRPAQNMMFGQAVCSFSMTPRVDYELSATNYELLKVQAVVA